MGEIYKLSCKCGYKKELNTGGGLASCTINTVNRVFSEEKRKDFDIYYKNNDVQNFSVENELSYCDKCKEIMSIAVLKIQLINNINFAIAKDCPVCGNKIRIINNFSICPKCGRKIAMKEIGNWD